MILKKVVALKDPLDLLDLETDEYFLAWENALYSSFSRNVPIKEQKLWLGNLELEQMFSRRETFLIIAISRYNPDAAVKLIRQGIVSESSCGRAHGHRNSCVEAIHLINIEDRIKDWLLYLVKNDPRLRRNLDYFLNNTFTIPFIGAPREILIAFIQEYFSEHQQIPGLDLNSLSLYGLYKLYSVLHERLYHNARKIELSDDFLELLEQDGYFTITEIRSKKTDPVPHTLKISSPLD